MSKSVHIYPSHFRYYYCRIYRRDPPPPTPRSLAFNPFDFNALLTFSLPMDFFRFLCPISCCHSEAFLRLFTVNFYLLSLSNTFPTSPLYLFAMYSISFEIWLLIRLAWDRRLQCHQLFIYIFKMWQNTVNRQRGVEKPVKISTG
jgi:hypothetical protein